MFSFDLCQLGKFSIRAFSCLLACLEENIVLCRLCDREEQVCVWLQRGLRS